MCVADLYAYIPERRAKVCAHDRDILAGASPLPSLPRARGVSANPLACDAGIPPGLPPEPTPLPASQASLHPSIIIRTHHGVPRVPSDDDRLGIWAAKFFGNGHHRFITE